MHLPGTLRTLLPGLLLCRGPHWVHACVRRDTRVKWNLSQGPALMGRVDYSPGEPASLPAE